MLQAESLIGRPLLAWLFLFVATAMPVAAQPAYDVLIRNGRVLDGSGNPWFYADVAILGARIAAVGDLAKAEADTVIDATGIYVAPGFVDVHSHAAAGLATPELSHARPLLAQGITTVFVNPDGGGAVDLPKQRAELEKDGLGVNVAQFVPHGAVRDTVLGMADRTPTGEELARMKGFVEAGMEAGAFGLSSGPFYAPGSFAETDELVALAKVAARYGGVYQSHIRDESNYSVGLVVAVDEVIRVAREADLPGIVTHIKALGPPVWGFSTAIVRRIERARQEGIEVYADQYPYEASATGLASALLPRWAQAGGRDSLLSRIGDPDVRPRVLDAMAENLARRGGAERIQIRTYEPDTTIQGKTLAWVAGREGKTALETALALIEGGYAGIVSFNMDAADVQTFMQQPWTMTCSDGGLVPMGQGVPHPRNYGTFPRKIRTYVLEEHAIDLAAAIRSMTYLPASVMGLPDRGLLRSGTVADIVVFDLEQIQDRATFGEPHQLSEGIIHVFVGGRLALQDGRFTDVRNGRVLGRSQ
ncbi:MAG: N-acyl-D-amino-acid deacylase family protein [Rhodothermales bacterium]